MKPKMIGMIAGVVMIAMLASVMPVSAYNGQGAANYVTSHWNSNVPGSWYFQTHGGDCTNFISWCLKNGGGWQTTDQWYSNWPYWTGSSHSNSWTVANDFGSYMISSGRASACSLGHHPWNDYFDVGDIVLMDNRDGQNNPYPDGRWDHTMIVTGINGDQMYMTYHTTNTVGKPLTQIMSENSDARFMGYRL